MKVVTVFLVFLSWTYAANHNKSVVCYYGSWAHYRQSLGKFTVDNIDVDLSTHLIYTFVGIDSNGFVVSLDPYLDYADDNGLDNFAKFNALKRKNPMLKTILAVGGWNEGSAKYSVMANDPLLRRNFIVSAARMILRYGFDGLDLDWEYPNRRDSVHGTADIDNFSKLVKEIKSEFKNHNLILTAAVAAIGKYASLSYDIKAISEYLDMIHLMTYDFYGPWNNVTGHNAGLHKGEGDVNVEKENVYSVDVALDYWLGQGCPPEKLVVGIPLYGHTFTLQRASVNGLKAPSIGVGIAGPYTLTNGFLGYNEFCFIIMRERWDLRYDSLAKVPYAVQNINWISYDNMDSITRKIEYAMNKNLGGIMVWSIETDDFQGLCHNEAFPLMKTAVRVLERLNSGSTTLFINSICYVYVIVIHLTLKLFRDNINYH